MGESVKYCKWCSKEFTPEKLKKGGYSVFEFCCRECYNQYKKDYNKKYNDSHKKEHQEYYNQHKEERLSYQNKYRLEHRDEINKKKHKYYYQNRDRLLEVRKQSYKLNPKRKIDNIAFKAIYTAIKEKRENSNWNLYFSFSISEFLNHIESLFTSEMNWKNYGSYWEVDHIVPRIRFYYEKYTDEQFKQCWSLDNIRPLTIKENRERKRS